MKQTTPPLPHSKARTIVWVLAAVQFINILDFMMVMPLGPDFSRALGIPLSQLGLIGGSYTAAAAVAGIAGSLFLDRFDRRKALAVALLGLAVGTLSGALATGLYSLVAARLFAGLFGGPATALSLAIVADVIPPEKRGRAMGIVMSAFGIASVAGVPAGLELARLGGWWMPFTVVGGLAALASLMSRLALPPLRSHLDEAPSPALPALFALLRQPLVLIALSITMLGAMSMYSLVPNLASYVQANLGYPRERLGLLYLFGGLASFVSMRLSGPLVDRLGAAPIGAVATTCTAAVMYFGLVDFSATLGVAGIFVGLMAATSARNISFQAMSSRVPAAASRARYMSLQSATQHLAAACGAVLSTRLLAVDEQGALVGMPRTAGIAAGLSLALPPLFFLVARGLRQRETRSEPMGKAASQSASRS